MQFPLPVLPIRPPPSAPAPHTVQLPSRWAINQIKLHCAKVNKEINHLLFFSFHPNSLLTHLQYSILSVKDSCRLGSVRSSSEHHRLMLSTLISRRHRLPSPEISLDCCTCNGDPHARKNHDCDSGATTKLQSSRRRVRFGVIRH